MREVKIEPVMPVDREAEQMLIGAVFRNNALAVTLEIAPEHFHDVLHQKLWAVAQNTVARGGVFALGPIVRAMPELGDYLRALVDSTTTNKDSETIRGWVQSIKDTAGRRRVYVLARNLAEQILDPGLLTVELVAEFMREAAMTAMTRRSASKSDVAREIYEDLGRPPACYSTGLAGLDRVIGGGMFAGFCYGIAARKKVGKTVALGTISHNLNRAGVDHWYGSLEMSPKQIEQRNMAREMGINSIQFLTRKMQGLDRLVAEYSTVIKDHTVFDHMPGETWENIKRAMINAIATRGIKGAILDYWQLVGGKLRGESEEYHLRTVAQGFADFCRQHGIWGLMAAQVNQDGNTRGGEGLKLACDVYFTLHREKDAEEAWLEMEESRYVLYDNVGSVVKGDKGQVIRIDPGLMMNMLGPFFEDPNVASEQPGELPL